MNDVATQPQPPLPLRWWRRVPILIRAVVAGFLVLTVGSLVTGPALLGNTRFLPSVPWVLPATAAVLWLYWQYLKGRGWPAATATARRESLRAAPLSGRLWGWALVAGGAGLVSIVAFRFLSCRLYTMGRPDLGLDFQACPPWTLGAMILSISLTAGVIEEAAFRGYLQRPLERRYGVTVAIAITGLLFWAAHLSHASITVTHLPFHLAVSVLLGVLSYLTGSILPAVVLHATGDVILLPIYLFQGPPLFWNTLSARPVWETGLDAPFVGFLSFTVVFAVAAVLGLRQLARAAHSQRRDVNGSTAAARRAGR